MTDDLVRRLRSITDITLLCKDCHKSFEAADEAADRIEQLEAALRNIAEGDIPRTVRKVFRDDGKPTKNDRCGHGQWMYEECGCCIEDYARAALEEKKDD